MKVQYRKIISNYSDHHLSDHHLLFLSVFAKLLLSTLLVFFSEIYSFIFTQPLPFSIPHLWYLTKFMFCFLFIWIKAKDDKKYVTTFTIYARRHLYEPPSKGEIKKEEQFVFDIFSGIRLFVCLFH